MPLMGYDQYLIYLKNYETKHWYGRGFRQSLTMQPVTEAMKMPAGPGRNFAVLTAIAKVRVLASRGKQDQYGELLEKLERQIQTSGRRDLDLDDAAVSGYVGAGVTVRRYQNDNRAQLVMTRLRANSFRNALSSTPLMARMWALRRRLPLVSYVGITDLTTMRCYMAPAYCRKPPRNSRAAENYIENYGPEDDGVMNIIHPQASMNMNPEITASQILSIDKDIPIYNFPANPFNPLTNDPDWMAQISSLIDGQAHGSLCALAGSRQEECLGWALKFDGSLTKVKMRFASGRNSSKFNNTIQSLTDHPGRDMNMNYAFSLADWVRRCLGGSNLELKIINSPRSGKNTWAASFAVSP